MTRLALLALLGACALAAAARRRPREPELEPDIQSDPWPASVLANVTQPDPPYLEALPLARMRAAYNGKPVGRM